MERVVILVGTETGNAEDVAEELAGVLGEEGMEVEIVDMEGADLGVFGGDAAIVVCSATHGDGELPDNSVEFYEALDEERPDLSGVPFAVCALGDNAYADFCEAGKIWSRILGELGAVEVIERHEIDEGPDEDDVEEALEWAVRVASEFAAAVR